MAKTTLAPLTQDLALHAADISLEKKLPLADAIIYANALMNKAELVTSDSDFEGLPQVVYIKDSETNLS